MTHSKSSADGAPEPSPWSVLLSRPALAMLLLLFAWPLASKLPTFRKPATSAPSAEAGLLPQEEQRVGESALELETKTRNELAQPLVPNLETARGPIAASKDDGFKVPRIDAEAPPLAIVDEARSLDKFYAALTRTAKDEPNALTRILFHGDSMVASDYITATLRRKLQAQFGDAGHGFVLMADPWPSYFHNDIFRFATKGFKVARVVGPYATDGLYGLGGVSFEAPPGVRARFGTAIEGDFGRRVSRFRLLYLKQPHGGELLLNVDGKEHSVISTASETKTSGFVDIAVSDGEHLFEVVAKSGMTRTFGAILERDEPGVVLDAIGIQGARIRFLDKQDDQHWAEQLALRAPNLIVYQFGANESGDGFAYSMEDYHATMKAVLEQAKRAVPDAGCLVLAAMDRARKEGEGLITVPIIPHIVKEQEATAHEVGCAFFNTYEAMGGKGSMAKWVRRGLGQADLTHPSGYGAQVLGNWLYQALMSGFNDYGGATTQKPMIE
jgi:lysophospholipase L1-like esterase